MYYSLLVPIMMAADCGQRLAIDSRPRVIAHCRPFHFMNSEYLKITLLYDHWYSYTRFKCINKF